MKASTISTAFATSCGLALAVSAHPASAWQEERVPTLEIASEEEVKARLEREELEAQAKLSRVMANLRAESALAFARTRARLNCEDGAEGSTPRFSMQDLEPRVVEEVDIGSGFRFSRGIGGDDVDYGRRLCTDLEDGNFLAMTRAGVERLREAEIEPDRDYGTEFLVFSDGTLIAMDVGSSADFSEDPEGSDEDSSDEDRGADGAGIDDFDEDPEGSDEDTSSEDQGADGTGIDEFDEDPEGSDDDTEPTDDSTAGSTVDPDAVIPPQRTGATGLSGQFETSNENGIIFGAVIWWLYGPGGVEVQNYRRNQLLVDLVPGATYRVVAKELGENGRTAELTFTPQGTGFTFTRGLRFQ